MAVPPALRFLVLLALPPPLVGASPNVIVPDAWGNRVSSGRSGRRFLKMIPRPRGVPSVILGALSHRAKVGGFILQDAGFVLLSSTVALVAASLSTGPSWLRNPRLWAGAPLLQDVGQSSHPALLQDVVPPWRNCVRGLGFCPLARRLRA